MLKVICLDGLDINLVFKWKHELPTLQYLFDTYSLSKLDVAETFQEPYISPDIWATFFSGVTKKIHRCGFKKFSSPAIFIWNYASSKGYKAIALCMYISVPPYCYNCKIPSWLKLQFPSVTESEIKFSTSYLLERSLALLNLRPDFFAVTFPELDRMSHLFFDKEEKMKTSYKNIDRVLKFLLPYIEHDYFMILSDHGFEFTTWEIARRAFRLTRLPLIHRPEGLMLSNYKVTNKCLQVYRIMRSIFD